MNRLSTLGPSVAARALVVSLLALSVAACGGDDTGSKTPESGGPTTPATGTGGTDSGTSTPGTGATTVSAISTKVMVPADFTGEPVKIIFGWGDKQILDETGKLKNVPEQFLPNISGIANPKLVAGQPYDFDLSGISIPPGEHYVLVAVYVKGTAGTIPQKDKDWVAGSLTKISFTGPTTTMPPMEFKKSQGVGM